MRIPRVRLTGRRGGREVFLRGAVCVGGMLVLLAAAFFAASGVAVGRQEGVPVVRENSVAASAAGYGTATSAQASSGDENLPAAPVEVEKWTKPQPGWLYVLDVRPDGDAGGRVWLVDPASGQIMGSIRTSYHPDFALSPDGTRLYIASDPRQHATEIAVVDTVAGTVLGGQEVKNRVEPRVLPTVSAMAVSRDGAVLWVLTKPADYSQLVAIETATGNVLGGQPDMGHCEDGQFVSFPNAGQVSFVCPTMKRIHLIHVDAKGKTLDSASGDFPWDHTLGVATAFSDSDDPHSITVVRRDGGAFRMDETTLSFSGTAAKGDEKLQVYPGSWPVSPDGRIFLGYSKSAGAYVPNTLAEEIRVFNTTTWKQEGKIKPEIPFWSAAVSRDGKRLYVISPQEHFIMVFDTGNFKQVRTISVGAMPALAMVQP